MPLLAIAILLAASLPADPTGLWAGKARFGPELKGDLTIERDGKVWRAEISGRTAEAEQLNFEFAGGAFQGALQNDRIVGHWIQPRTGSSGFRYASPVTLRKIGEGRWRGTTAPLDDEMTYFIPIDSNGNAFLRNPERNAGRFTSIERAVVEGSKIKFFAADKSLTAEGPFDGESFSIPIRGASVDFHRADAADEAVYYPRGKNPKKYVYRKPPAEDDGWAVGTLEEAGISRDDLSRLIQMIIDMPVDAHSVDLHAVLIARHGKLVLEEYFHGFSRDKLHETRSASKSLTSLMIGAAMLHGTPISPSTSVYRTMDPKVDDPQKLTMTLENLLTMSSGLDCDDNDEKSPGNEDVMQEQTAQPDWYQYTLDLKMIRTPGEKAVYCSCQPNLAGGMLARTTHKWLPDVFREWVATPMQIRRYAINLTPTGDSYMGGGARFLARDFMKLGQVLLDGGRWRGTQIVSASWAKKSASPLYELYGFHYGYLWWSTEYPYKDRKVSAFFAAGNGGQIVLGFPELDLLINFWGGSYNDRAGVVPQRDWIPRYILPAVK